MLAKQVIEFARLGYIGFYAATAPIQGADMADLKTYVTARTMLDPLNADPDAFLAEYTNFTYGPRSAPGVRRYLSLMEASFQQIEKPISPTALDYRGVKCRSGGCRRITPWNAVYANTTILESGAALKAAEALATTALYRANVQTAALSIQFMALLRWEQLRLFAIDKALTWPFAADKAVEFGLFASTFDRMKVVSFGMYEENSNTAFTCNLTCFRAYVGLA